LSAKRDHWWELPGDEAIISQELSQAWQQHARPWMNSFTTPESVLDGLVAGKHLFMASKIYLKMGQKEKAKEYLHRWLALSKNENPYVLD
jgi:hypothetical protein